MTCGPLLDSRTPLVFGVVALLAFVLLMCAFRSITIPLVSIAAEPTVRRRRLRAGHADLPGRAPAGLLGFTSFGALVPWVPLFTFVMLFGLSMDYHVFILSRIRELWTGGASARDAIVDGVGRSAGVVTSAAIIMVAVFSIFATLSMIDVKMLGVGLAAAVLIDATVVRGVVLPAAWRCSASGPGTCQRGCAGCPAAAWRVSPSPRSRPVRPPRPAAGSGGPSGRRRPRRRPSSCPRQPADCRSGQRQDLVAVGGDHEGVLELRGALAVLRHAPSSRPARCRTRQCRA